MDWLLQFFYTFGVIKRFVHVLVAIYFVLILQLPFLLTFSWEVWWISPSGLKSYHLERFLSENTVLSIKGNCPFVLFSSTFSKNRKIKLNHDLSSEAYFCLSRMFARVWSRHRQIFTCWLRGNYNINAVLIFFVNDVASPVLVLLHLFLSESALDFFL